jgi:uncharacterized protein YbaR (Trm112 family)
MSTDPKSTPGKHHASEHHAGEHHQVDPRLLELLVCPLTKTTLIYDAQTNELISRAAGLAFPIRNGVPLLIEEAARPLAADPRR